MNGIFLLKSENYKENHQEEMKIDDLVPNILYMAGLKGRNYLDGEFNSKLIKNSKISKKSYEISCKYITNLKV